MLNNTEYLAGDTLTITDVGDSFLSGSGVEQNDPGPSLVCVTSNVNTMCFSGRDHPGNGSVGNWLYPDGTTVLGKNANPNGSITRSSHIQQIRLNRKRTVPNWSLYTCEVPDESDNDIIHTATITLGECTFNNPYFHSVI